MKKQLWLLLLVVFTSCNAPRYLFVDSLPQQQQIDFSKGKWLLNEIDCDGDNKDLLTTKTNTFFSKKLATRFSNINNEKSLLMTQKSYFKASKANLKDLKKGTDFDFLINVVAKKNRSEIAGIQLYQKEIAGTNESEVFLEIVDLNLQEVIFSEHVVGKFQKNTQRSVWDTPNKIKSIRLVDNLNVNTTSNKLLLGSLDKILQKLDKSAPKKTNSKRYYLIKSNFSAK